MSYTGVFILQRKLIFELKHNSCAIKMVFLVSLLSFFRYDEAQCSKVRNSLTPYRCYVLPEHYCMLINQVLVERNNKIG